MKPKRNSSQLDLFKSQLSQMLDPNHALIILAEQIDWSIFDTEIDACYCDDFGSPGCNTRLMIGLHYLKYAFNESDESVIARWVENPYWQFFCGFQYMQHDFPIDPSSMSKWRGRVGAERLETMLQATIQTAQSMKLIKNKQLEEVNVDTTVQEKAVAFPTDARLYFKMRRALVRQAKALGINLRQSYKFVSKKALIMQGRYSHARHGKRAARMTRKLKTILGRVVRDIQRKAPRIDGEMVNVMLREYLHRAERLLLQTRKSKNKLYSVHAPEVECIAKGKIHKKYEFGCKVGFVTTSKGNWVVSAQAFHENPYDGHTLHSALTHTEKMTGHNIRIAVTDLGYRGHDYEGEATVYSVRTIPKTAKWSLRRLLKRRSSIEPTIGHLKSDNRLHRNHLKGREGDRMNAVLCAAGYNFRKLLAAITAGCFFAQILWLWHMIQSVVTQLRSAAVPEMLNHSYQFPISHLKSYALGK